MYGFSDNLIESGDQVCSSQIPVLKKESKSSGAFLGILQ